MFSLLRRWRARRLIATTAMDANRLDARSVGALESVVDGRLVGWVFDADRPGEVLALDIFVDGLKVDTVCADVPRGDLASHFGAEAAFGFDVSPAALREACDRVRHVSVHLTHRLGVKLGPLEIEPIGMRPDFGSRHLFAHVTASSETIYAMVRAIEDETRHVFDHVTATHERILARIATHTSDAIPPRSGFAGVGRFDDRETTDAVEEDIFRRRVEVALVGARLLS